MDFRFSLPKQLDPRINQQRPEEIRDPFEAPDQRDARQDEQSAHDKRAHDPPEQHLVLMVIVYFEIAKDHQKHKQVVDTERELNHVPSDELQHAGAAVPEENEHSKSGGQRDPHARPDESFAKADSMGSAIQHSQIEHQHRHDEEVKKN